jgi:hypothetical protein
MIVCLLLARISHVIQLLNSASMLAGGQIGYPGLHLVLLTMVDAPACRNETTAGSVWYVHITTAASFRQSCMAV